MLHPDLDQMLKSKSVVLVERMPVGVSEQDIDYIWDMSNVWNATNVSADGY